MEYSSFLPVGTVVELKNAKRKLVIIGIFQLDLENEVVYDYVGVLYPEGYIGSNSCFLFNKEDIKNIVYQGYDDDDRKGYISMMDTALQQVNEVLSSDEE